MSYIHSCVLLTVPRHGADVELCDSEGRTSFHWAMKTPNIQCLKVLCKHANSIIVNKTVGLLASLIPRLHGMGMRLQFSVVVC